MSTKSFLAGILTGAVVAALVVPKMLRNIIEETNLVNENEHIKRHQDIKSLLDKSNDYKERYPD